ncbi:YcgN family cysteine cluster protein [Methyloterricola oryzae]|uniref:YcgN family cysteine cluster protein n=1 Tax=Methyloterricola oryzae TaxID=1495050 RepID=UPI0005EB4AF6|nr:YcgN family cysteine cluster protein [Methyloterricola oryzae]
MKQNPKPFWRSKSLTEMSLEEWESLCDGCGKCCLHKIEDEDTGELFFTRVSCRLLDIKTCRCGEYARRTQAVADCLDLRKDFQAFNWLPSTCAYRLLAEGDELPAWHPLVSGDAHSVRDAGACVSGFAISETQVDDILDHVIEDLN